MVRIQQVPTTMLAYTGDTRDAALREALTAHGVGLCALPRMLRGVAATAIGVERRVEALLRDWPQWFYDNGAFAAHQAGELVYLPEWLNTAECVAALPVELRPDFAILPDVVAGGLESLALSTGALQQAHSGGWGDELSFALAVQDGITPVDVDWAAPFDVLFVGGSLEWKLETGAAWVRAAHAHGNRCHIGRVGTVRRTVWAREAGADSVDSCLPLWSRAKAADWLEALGAS